VNVKLNANWWEWTCSACGHENSVLSAAGWTLGWRILEKTKYEFLIREDFSTSIVFSAMAFEAELARLFFKWTKIDTRNERLLTMSDEELDDEYRKLGRNIAERLESVTKLLDPRGVDDFARDSELGGQIDKDFPSLNLGSLARDFQQSLFWPRNRILHTGYADYTKDDALRCHNIALVGLTLLREMDTARRTT
jgi:hypothetical protein